VPIEGALAAALTVDPDLTSAAVEGSVYIATPTTLMIALRTAANVWQVERRNRNAEEIAARAGKIYDKLFGFVESMDGLGKALGTAHRQYDRAMNQLARGNGNVLRQVEHLKTLGAKTNRSMPGNLLDDSAELAVEDAAD
jgi:DNA recombination protein RmuC